MSFLLFYIDVLLLAVKLINLKHWFWRKQSHSISYMLLVLSCAFVIIIYCFFCCFLFVFIHYYSVDSSHPSSHPPSATDGAAGANATDNANASLVNGTSRTPSLFYLIDLSLNYVRSPLSSMNCTDVLCVSLPSECSYSINSTVAYKRCHKHAMSELFHSYGIRHGSWTNRNSDVFPVD